MSVLAAILIVLGVAAGGFWLMKKTAEAHEGKPDFSQKGDEHGSNEDGNGGA